MKKIKIYSRENNLKLANSLLFAGIILFLCNSCSIKVNQFYEGPKKPSSEVALLTCYNNNIIIGIDSKIAKGESLFRIPIMGWNKGKCLVELEPGNHEILVNVLVAVNSERTHSLMSGTDSYNYTYSFEARKGNFVFLPGKIYQIISDKDSTKIVEVKTIPKLSDVYDEKNRVVSN